MSARCGRIRTARAPIRTEVAPNRRTLQVLSLAAKLSGQGVTDEEEAKSQDASGCASDVQ
jgi:hypothetical protein